MNIHSNDVPAPTISVVIPLYNKGKYIERALASVLAQTYFPLEIIVVDDGSTDDGSERVRRLHKPNIILIRQENKGPGAARNAGLTMAMGKYIAFLDADDEWYPSFLEKGISYLENDELGVSVVSTGYFTYPTMRSNSKGLEHLKGAYEVTFETGVNLISDIEKYVHMGFSIIRTDIAKKLGGYFDGFRCLRGEDSHFLLKLLFNERIGIIPEPYGLYHTEASDLYGCGFKTAPPLEPYLREPDDIIAVCPQANRRILKEFLSLQALDRAMMYSKLGEKKLALELLARFCSNGKPYTIQIIKARLLAQLAPVLPALRRIWRFPKRVLAREKKDYQR